MFGGYCIFRLQRCYNLMFTHWFISFKLLVLYWLTHSYRNAERFWVCSLKLFLRKKLRLTRSNSTRLKGTVVKGAIVISSRKRGNFSSYTIVGLSIPK